MYETCKKALAFALSLILVIGAVPVFAAADTDTAASVSLPSIMGGKNVMRAAYTASDIKINGLATEEGWSMLTPVGEEASIGAQWDNEYYYLAVRNPEKKEITVTLNGTKLTADNSQSKVSTNKMNTEYRVSLKKIGVTVDGYGTKIATKVQVGNHVWEGESVLTAIDWFSADNDTRRSPALGSGKSGMRLVHAYSSTNGQQNVASLVGGYNLYDKYAEGVRPAISMRTYVTLGGDIFAPMGDRTADTIVEFDFHADAMPVYEVGVDNDFWGEYTTCGFAWWMTDANDRYVTMGIVNTDIGLVYVLQKTERTDKNTGPMYSHALNKKVGDTFRIGTVWTTEGDIILYLDGEVIEVFENVEGSHSRVTSDNTITLSIMRNTENAKSSADDINVSVTNLAAGKYYGENALDVLRFSTIARDPIKNTDAYSVIGQLSLPTKLENPIFPATAITWESSDPSVIDASTGKVTRPATNGKLVTLTATETATGEKKSIEVFVKGLAPASNVLVIESDTTPYKGEGAVADVHEFTFDVKNNSIIRDLGESAKVNVIALKDKDEINKLNEAMVTIWASDDNKEYTQVPSFKMLRDGQYTYLYDFETTARYIKVHCTDCGVNDGEFTAPLEGMIEAYYENVFGDGGTAFTTESTVTLKNDTDTAKFDFIAEISPADAGVACVAKNNADVRFYLDGEMLYHYFDGTNFFVRVTKIPKNSSVTLQVLSGNADAKDVSNKTNVYEIVHGTVDTSYSLRSRYMLTLPDGKIFAFCSGGENNSAFSYAISKDGGRSWSANITATGSFDYLCVPQGVIYDEATGRILVQGWRRESGVLETRYMYTDDMGRTWKKAPLTQTGDYYSTYLLSYSNIAVLSCKDGDGPNVDYVHALYTSSPAMEEYYDNGYSQGVTRVAYTTDNGLTWTLSPDDIAFYEGEASGEHTHIREHGNCEHCILEAADGTVVVYMRCQYDNVYTLSRSVSKDHGKTWQTHAELSDVYAVNCQPMMFNHADNQFMLWPGNNMYGQASFRRFPLVVGVSYDNLMTFENIIDLYSKTAFQGLMTGSAMDNTNPQMTMVGDTLLAASSQMLRVENFTDYFFRTRGAYDTFEHTTAEYEGWSTTGGTIEISDKVASEGKNSMRIAVGASAARSIPYLQNGTVAFDLYIEDVDKAKFEFELESAYGFEYGLAAPIAFRLIGDKATFLGASSATQLPLKEGWNHFAFTLDLQNETPAATLSVNGGDAFAVPVNAEIGDYICFVHVRGLGELEYYLDEFLINDLDNAYVPDIVVSAEANELAEVPEDFADLYTDLAAMTADMQSLVLEGAGETFSAEKSKAYALSPIISKDGGDTWTEATLADIPANGMTVKLGYPEGTSAKAQNFRAISISVQDESAVATVLNVTEAEDGLYVRVSDCAPVVVAWEDAPAEGPSLLLIGAIGIGVLAVAFLVVAITIKPKKKDE